MSVTTQELERGELYIALLGEAKFHYYHDEKGDARVTAKTDHEYEIPYGSDFFFEARRYGHTITKDEYLKG
jgi:hypothetical protein